MTWFLNLFTGGVLNRLVDAYAKHKDSAVESERIKAEVAKDQIAAEVQAQGFAREVRLATAGFWEMRLMTTFIALPFVLHVNLVGLDTNFSLGWGIPAFPRPFDEWEGAILLSFFGIYTIGKGVTAVAAAVMARRR